jgi:hypothetical protein
MFSAHDEVVDGSRGPSPAAFRDAWQAARNDATLAYRYWCQAGADTKRDAYAVYLAAADREAAASTALVADRAAEHVARPH